MTPTTHSQLCLHLNQPTHMWAVLSLSPRESVFVEVRKLGELQSPLIQRYCFLNGETEDSPRARSHKCSSCVGSASEPWVADCWAHRASPQLLFLPLMLL